MDKRSKDDLKLPTYMNSKSGGAPKAAPVSAAKKKAEAAHKKSAAKKSSSKKPTKKGASKSAKQKQDLQIPANVNKSARKKTSETQQKRTKSRKRINYGRLAAVMLVFVLLIGGSVFLISKLGERDDSSLLTVGTSQTLPEGVSILGIDVGGQTKTNARAAVVKAADEVISNACVTVNCGGEEYTITGGDISLAYDIESVLQRAMQYTSSEEGGVVDVTTGGTSDNITDIFTWNQKTLEMAVEDIAAKFDKAAAEPTVNANKAEDGTLSFDFTGGQSGRKLNVESVQSYITNMFGAGSFTFTMEGEYSEITPSVTLADLQTEFGLRATYTTEYYTSRSDETTQNRVFNIEKAAGIINGCMVAPNEEWSFNGYVGLRTYEGGWKAANGIADGKEYVLQAGGGICQVSSTLYNALLCANVEVTDRRAHTIPSDYVPKGLDATVDSSGIDLKFRNDTGAPLFLFAYIEDQPDSKYDTITFEIYGKKLEEGVTYKTRSEVIETIRRKDVNYTDDNTIPRGYKLVTVAARDGYKVEAYRDKYVNGQLDSSELLYTDTYRGNAEEARRGTASPKYYTAPEGAKKIED